MKLMIFLLGSCASLLFILFLFLYLCEKYHITIPSQLHAPAPVPVSPEFPIKAIYLAHQADYKQFANLVHDCLRAVEGKCGLICHGEVPSIYCTDKSVCIQETAKRVLIFRYELRCERPLTAGGLKNSSPKQMKREDIAKLFQENLPDYMEAGYNFEGKISVWDIGENRCYIEIPGVYRCSGTNVGLTI